MKNSLSRLVPFVNHSGSKDAFVEQFQKIASLALAGVGQLAAALKGQPGEALARIVEIEHSADDAVREIHRLVDKTFIAPYDKGDIVLLARRLDRIVDAMRTAARFLVSFRALEAHNGPALASTATAMCEIILRSITRLKEVVDEMPAFHHDRLREAVRAIDVLEDECDELLAQAIGTIFPDPNQPLTAAMLAWRDIFRLLESTTDYCGHAMVVILSIARQEGS